MKHISFKNSFLTLLYTSSLCLSFSAYAVDVPDDTPAPTALNKEGERNLSNANNGMIDTQNDTGVNVGTSSADNPSVSSSDSDNSQQSPLSDDDKRELQALDKDLGSNADYDLLPANPTEEQKADYHMKMFVNRVGLMSGIVGLCSPKEQSLIQECGELILGNWKTLTGETPPKDTVERRKIFRTAWAKREIQAVLVARKMKNAPQCSKVIDDERNDGMWKICKRKFVDHPLDNPDSGN